MVVLSCFLQCLHVSFSVCFLQAFALMQDMRQRIANVNMAFYVNMATIENIHRSLGIPLGRGMGGDDTGDGDDLADDLEDEADIDLQIEN